MNDRQSEMTLQKRLMVPRVVIGTLLGGLATFAAIVALVLEPGRSEDNLTLQVAAAGGLVLGVAASLAAGGVLRAHYRKRGLSDPDLLAGAYFQTLVVRAACLEAPGFLCLIAYMVSGSRLGLVGAAVCFVLMAALFPTRASWDGFRDAVAATDGRTEPR